MRYLFLWLAGALALSACASHQKPTELTPAPPPAVVETAPAPQPAIAVAEPLGGLACATDDDCNLNQVCASGRCAAATQDLAECRPVTLFDFDRVSLQPAALPPLRRLARCMGAEPASQVTFQGHCDERGTTEYNLLLGDRRARAVESYVAGLGVEKGRLFTVSFGEERPVCLEHDEGCWQQNRRAAAVPGKPAEQPAPQAMR